MKSLSKRQKIDLMFDLINAFSRLRSAKESANFLQDLLTANEIKNLSIRLRIAKYLMEGLTQREINLLTGSSLVTINKVNSWLKAGGEGFKKVIKELPARIEEPESGKGVPIEFQAPQVLLKVAQHAASKAQEKRVESFTERVESKRVSDRKFRESY